MASLVNKDSYLQRLAKKICAQEARQRRFETRSGEEDVHPKKKRRKKLKKHAQAMGGAQSGKLAITDAWKAETKPTAVKAKNPGPGVHVASRANRSAAAEEKGNRDQNGFTGNQSRPDCFSTMTLLRQRLHEKIQEVSSQGRSKELSPAALKKQQRRKYEKERKKCHRKELMMRGKTEKKEADEVSTGAILVLPALKNDCKSSMTFNKVEVHEKQLNKAEKRKGTLTPLTGKNYKQLLSRLEIRKNKLEDLKDKDETKALEMETKMRWTNVLYKAEGVKIRDDEDRLRKALKRKEQRKAQCQRQWEKRTEQVVEKMQQRQDKRRKNIQKKKLAKMERKKSKARKRGRVLPEDLEKAGLQMS